MNRFIFYFLFLLTPIFLVIFFLLLGFALGSIVFLGLTLLGIYISILIIKAFIFYIKNLRKKKYKIKIIKIY
ncbi:MAG: hypothetical protein DRP29_03875 [Thermodesulfobacteriota bacterium]|nr:MAG: hypothetical protein DRP29_03875 [Thermodesulfobacteriota bacterium]RLG11359.1 MAG: hypothetical protein DRN73_05580 [Candidatus Pacearchaeota archaeon]